MYQCNFIETIANIEKNYFYSKYCLSSFSVYFIKFYTLDTFVYFFIFLEMSKSIFRRIFRICYYKRNNSYGGIEGSH